MTRSSAAIKNKTKNAVDLLTESVVRGMQEKKAKDIVILDLRGINGAVSDVFVICHGDSTTQVDSIARSVEEIVDQECSESPQYTEGRSNSQWVLIDYIGVVAHIFLKDQRDFYGLENLWGDAQITKIG